MFTLEHLPMMRRPSRIDKILEHHQRPRPCHRCFSYKITHHQYHKKTRQPVTVRRGEPSLQPIPRCPPQPTKYQSSIPIAISRSRSGTTATIDMHHPPVNFDATSALAEPPSTLLCCETLRGSAGDGSKQQKA